MQVKKIIYYFIGLIAVVIAVGIYWVRYTPSERKAERLLSRCKTLTIGLSMESLNAFMGTPRLTQPSRDPKAIYYVYASPRAASEDTRIKIKDGKVVEIVCGEGFKRP